MAVARRRRCLVTASVDRELVSAHPADRAAIEADLAEARRREDGRVPNPLGDQDELAESGDRHNYAKVGSGRPTSLLYTNGPGAVMDLPQFTVMAACLDDWEPIWARRDTIPQIHAPRLRTAVRTLMRSRFVQLRPFPWQPSPNMLAPAGRDLGVTARVFPQWLRCTGCSMLGPITKFTYTNDQRFRPDQARFEHKRCTHGGRTKPFPAAAVPARYLLACVNGHLDEFPYGEWVHRGRRCEAAETPDLQMVERNFGRGASATIVCASCQAKRPMNEAQGEAGKAKLPGCRGRHPHLDDFAPDGCTNPTRLMLIGASNLWFAATESIIVMPDQAEERVADLAERVRAALAEDLAEVRDQPRVARMLLRRDDSPALRGLDLDHISDDELLAAMNAPPVPPQSPEEQGVAVEAWDPVQLLVPEWQHLCRRPLGVQHEDPLSGLALSARERHPDLRREVVDVLAVDKLRKVNALVGFTRIDDWERVGELANRLAPITRTLPRWTVATEDRGEGIFLRLDESRVSEWERRVKSNEIWHAHVAAHKQNHINRFSETAEQVPHSARLKPPRYWLVHTLAHVLIREMAMDCGYSAASLSERLYAWEADPSLGREPAAGLLICTTASDSDGTLGGLVQLSEPLRFQGLVDSALDRATRCSSDPVCAQRTPQPPEDFLHGAACHCCAMASETSCERANRFLDRRFLLDLPGSDLGFFGSRS